MIQAEHITKTFHGFKALDDMSLHVPKGTIYGLVVQMVPGNPL